MGYPKDVLSTRSVIKTGLYAVIPPEGLVKNVVPGLEGCEVSIIASPKLGAGFAQYMVHIPEILKKDANVKGKDDVEIFMYCINGDGYWTVDGEKVDMVSGAYIYVPCGKDLSFNITGTKQTDLILYKQKYTKLEEQPYPPIVTGNVYDMEYENYDGMENVQIKDLLPKDLRFDMNMHILSFLPGGCHPFVETHVQEHGAYILEGEGMYLLDNEWMPIKKEDFIWFGAYVTQGAYGVGRERFTYIYSKDCNRDVEL